MIRFWYGSGTVLVRDGVVQGVRYGTGFFRTRIRINPYPYPNGGKN